MLSSITFFLLGCACMCTIDMCSLMFFSLVSFFSFVGGLCFFGFLYSQYIRIQFHAGSFIFSGLPSRQGSQARNEIIRLTKEIKELLSNMKTGMKLLKAHKIEYLQKLNHEYGKLKSFNFIYEFFFQVRMLHKTTIMMLSFSCFYKKRHLILIFFFSFPGRTMQSVYGRLRSLCGPYYSRNIGQRNTALS
jgi:hypothetical protein